MMNKQFPHDEAMSRYPFPHDEAMSRYPYWSSVGCGWLLWTRAAVVNHPRWFAPRPSGAMWELLS